MAAGLAFTTPVMAQQYVFDQKIVLPGDAGYDYMAIDSMNHHLFISHGTAFNVVDLATEQPIAVIDGLKGVHGIAFANVVNKGFISDGRGKAVVVVDLTTFQKVKTIELPAEDEDGIIYDPYSQRVFCFCGDSKSVCVIDVHTLELVKVIDVKTLTVKATYPLAPCGGPTGIAYDPGHQRLFSGCRANKGLSMVDAVVYDGADQYSVIQTLATQPRAKTMAMDMKTKKIYLSAPQFEPGTRKIVPGTFAVYVYKPA